jgi:uroporphyrinogen decarboxylase
MNKIERVRAAIKGEPVDRIPASFYSHNHFIESQTDKIAGYLLNQNEKFDWDFLKAGLRPSYYAEAWGCKARFYPDRVPELETHLIHKADDFRKLEKLDPQKGVLGEHVMVARELNKGLKGEELFVMTLFSPLAVAGRLAGGVVGTASEYQNLLKFIEDDPEAVRHGLSIITQTLADYGKELIRAGADGIFLSTSVWSGDVMSQEDYKVFAKPYELAIYKTVINEGATYNILHICRENILFDIFSDYPVEVINYDSTSPRNLSLKEAMSKTNKALWGGVDHRRTLVEGPVEKIISEVHAALDQTGGKRFFIGPGCTSNSAIPDQHYQAVKHAISTWRK